MTHDPNSRPADEGDEPGRGGNTCPAHIRGRIATALIEQTAGAVKVCAYHLDNGERDKAWAWAWIAARRYALAQQLAETA